MSGRLARLLLFVVGAAGWAVFGYMTIFALAVGWRLTTGGVWQADWHVYVAGARDLLAGDLYEGPLFLGGLVLSTDEFNLPPLSAAWAVPLFPLPIFVGGLVWQLISGASVAAAATIAALLLELRRPLIWAGIAVGIASVTLVYLEGLHLGTNNYLVLAIVAGFSLSFLKDRDRAAGLLLGLAIATKGWPIALLLPVIREGRWRVLGWAVGLVAAQAVLFFLWLGPDLPGDLLRAMHVTVPPTGYLIGPSGWEWTRPAWNSGLSLAVAAALLLVPATGRLGIALAILAGLAPITNLWLHYAPTLLFAAALMVPSARRLAFRWLQSPPARCV